MKASSLAAGLLALLVAATGGCAASKHLAAERDEVREHLALGEELDFEALQSRNWDRVHELHTEDVIVTFPDGHQTFGLTRHEQDVKAMFEWAPDLKIERHLVRLGQGSWTAVIGVMSGTFTQPMRLRDGKTIPPTGKRFEVPIATFARWRKDRISDEHLFWDEGAIRAQLGIGE